MLKTYRNYLFVIILLGILALYFYLSDKKTTLNIANNHFAITDTSAISKISIISGTDTLILEQVGDNWLVNQKYNAKIKLIKAVLGLMQSVGVKSPVPKALKQEVSACFSKNAVFLRFETNSKLKNEFEICEIEKIGLGTFIREPGSSDMYIADVPGFKSRLGLLFSVNPAIWTDNVIFRYKPWEMISIQVEYPNDPSGSFLLDLSKPDEMAITGSKGRKAIKKEDIVRYLYNFNQVACEPVVKGSESAGNNMPLCVVTIKNIANQTNMVRFFTKKQTENPANPDLFKLYAFMGSDSVPVLVKYIDIDPITKIYSELAGK